MKTPLASGYTLIELLAVLAILGILLTLTITGLNRLNRTTQLRTLATQFAADLSSMRSAAITRNLTGRLALNANGTAYTLQVGSEGPRTVNLPTGFTLSGVQDADGAWTATNVNTWFIAYSAPYGEVHAVPNGFQFRTTSGGLNPRVVRVVGVTGKVINGE